MIKYILISSVIISLIASCAKENSSAATAIDTNNNVVYDIDSNMYHIITVGTQIWMKENLSTTHYRNGEPIPNFADGILWSTNTSGAYCNYNNDTVNATIYGHLYNWYAVNNPSGLCPEGWHIPTDSDWTNLINYLGGQSMAGAAMKATILWNMPNTDANNKSSFSALPAGGRFENSLFSGVGYYGAFWSSTQFDNTHSLYRNLNYDNTQVYRAFYPMLSGLSCRCIKDKSY